MYRISESVRSTHTPDGSIILDIRQGQLFILNRVGSRILVLLEAGFSEPELVDRISWEFALPSDIVEGDIREFLQSLKTHRLVEELPADA